MKCSINILMYIMLVYKPLNLFKIILLLIIEMKLHQLCSKLM